MESFEFHYDELKAALQKRAISDDMSIIEQAIAYANEKHKYQKRKDGSPYIIHPLAVAAIVAEFGLDTDAILASLLHDCIEDTDASHDDIASQFGETVAELVEGVTKLTRANFTSTEQAQMENLRKMFMAMSKDIRVVLIKIADRLHNMRTMQYQTPAKQISKCRETMDIYAPLAHRLGMQKIKWELEDISLRYLVPDDYNSIMAYLGDHKEQDEAFMHTIQNKISDRLSAMGIHNTAYGRIKHVYSIYRKMQTQGKSIDELYDLYAFRVIVDTIPDCYNVLGHIHDLFNLVPGRFKDYISTPKPNMYQSLHTTVIGKQGIPFEVQIRTWEMHETAEYGIAAHWKYKQGSGGGTEKDFEWVRRLLETQQDSDAEEFVQSMKIDMFDDEVFVYTPKGRIVSLPSGSTPIDFAYSIHSAVGNKMVGARINGKIVNIDYKIQNGDRIEIITSQNSKGPSRDWLNIVKSSQAKNKINQWFKSEFKEDNIVKGRELIERYCKMKGVNISDLTKHEFVSKVLSKYNLKEWNAVLAAIGHGSIKEGHVVNRLIDEYEKKNKKTLTNEQILEEIAESSKTKKNIIKSKGGIVVRGVHDVSVRFSKCCNPVPGDEIVGFITRGRGISIHRTDCVNVMNLAEADRVRIMEADWQEEREKGEKYHVEIQIFCSNRTGLLADISKILTERNIDVQSMNSRTSKQDVATITMSFMIGGKDELNKLVDKIRMVDSVLDIVRSSS